MKLLGSRLTAQQTKLFLVIGYALIYEKKQSSDIFCLFGLQKKRTGVAQLSVRPSQELIIGILKVRLPFKVLGFSANVFMSSPIKAALSVCRVIVITILIIFHLDCV